MIGCNLDRLLLLLHELALHWLLLQINYVLILLGGVAFPYHFTFEAYGLFHLWGPKLAESQVVQYDFLTLEWDVLTYVVCNT